MRLSGEERLVNCACQACSREGQHRSHLLPVSRGWQVLLGTEGHVAGGPSSLHPVHSCTALAEAIMNPLSPDSLVRKWEAVTQIIKWARNLTTFDLCWEINGGN